MRYRHDLKKMKEQMLGGADRPAAGRVGNQREAKRHQELIAGYKQVLASNDPLVVERGRLVLLLRGVYGIRRVDQLKKEIRRWGSELDSVTKSLWADDCRFRFQVAEIMCGIYISKVLKLDKGSVIYDKEVSATPFGARRFDAYLSNESIAIESKQGYQSLTKRLRNQIQKDSYLLSERRIKRIIWLIHTRSSKRLEIELISNRIEVVKSWITPDIMTVLQNAGFVGDFMPISYFALKQDSQLLR